MIDLKIRFLIILKRTEMRTKQIEQITVDKMIFGGESINTTAFDKKVVMKGGITGQKVNVLIQKKRKDKIQAKILEVVEKSPLETQNVCKQYGRCGGCSMLSVHYEEQLKLKKQQILDLFAKNGTVLEDIDIVGSPVQKEYKNKMEFTFGNEEKDGKLTVGLHRKNSAMSIVDVFDCMIIDEDYRKILIATRDYFRTKNLKHYHVMSHEGYLRHLVVRKGTNVGDILVNLVTTSQIDFDLNEYKDLILSLELNGKISGILNTINDSLSDTVVADRVSVLYGDIFFYDKLFDNRFKISPFSFFQTNTKGAEVLYKTAIDMIDGEKNVIFDLYSGTGTIGINLSKRARKVIGIEIVEEAVDMARENAKVNNIENIEFVAGDVKEEVLKLKENILNKNECEDIDFIVLDPPRAGMSPKALGDVISYKAKELLYISCNPKMLAQDLVVFKENGYEIRNIKLVDMFPNTNHVECVVLMSRVAPTK